MRVRVRFRYNSETGEVETLLIEDIGGARPGADHDAVHDSIAADVARLVERDAVVDEVRGAAPAREAAPAARSEPTAVEPTTPAREARPAGE